MRFLDGTPCDLRAICLLAVEHPCGNCGRREMKGDVLFEGDAMECPYCHMEQPSKFGPVQNYSHTGIGEDSRAEDNCEHCGKSFSVERADDYVYVIKKVS